MAQLHLVGFWHSEDDCPLGQPTAEAAETLADILDKAQAIGFFSMKRHQGAALAYASDPDELARQFEALLPNHQAQAVLAPADLVPYFDKPERLEDEPERHAFAALAALGLSELELERTEVEGLPSRSLRSLPDYLRQNAPR